MTRVLLAGAASADTTLAQTLRQEGYDTCASAESPGIDVVLFGTRDGSADFMQQLAGIPVIVLSRNPDPKAIVTAMRAGAADYLVRPFSRGELCASLEQAQSMQGKKQHDAAGLAHMLGNSPPMQTLRELIQRAGPTQSPVLISGETGSGKEMVARAVHASSKRNAQPLIVMNCAAVPEALQEIELFGESSASSSMGTSSMGTPMGLHPRVPGEALARNRDRTESSAWGNQHPTRRRAIDLRLPGRVAGAG